MKYAYAYSYYAERRLDKDNIPPTPERDNLVDESGNEFIDHESQYIVVKGPNKLVDHLGDHIIDDELQYITV